MGTDPWWDWSALKLRRCTRWRGGPQKSKVLPDLGWFSRACHDSFQAAFRSLPESPESFDHLRSVILPQARNLCRESKHPLLFHVEEHNQWPEPGLRLRLKFLAHPSEWDWHCRGINTVSPQKKTAWTEMLVCHFFPSSLCSTWLHQLEETQKGTSARGRTIKRSKHISRAKNDPELRVSRS